MRKRLISLSKSGFELAQLGLILAVLGWLLGHSRDITEIIEYLMTPKGLTALGLATAVGGVVCPSWVRSFSGRKTHHANLPPASERDSPTNQRRGSLRILFLSLLTKTKKLRNPICGIVEFLLYV